MTDQSDIHAKTSKIGKPPHVKKVEHARPIRPALETLWINRVNHKVQKRLAPEDIHALFLTGSRGGVLAGNGLKSKAKSEDPKQ